MQSPLQAKVVVGRSPSSAARSAAFERALTRQADRSRRRAASIVIALFAAAAAFATALAVFDTKDGAPGSDERLAAPSTPPPPDMVPLRTR